jgi:DNA-binding transcriptional MerR regulator
VSVEASADPRDARRLTIGAVCDLLRREFSDVSISKIRYLEDQGLLHPDRTRGGYRLYGSEDVERLRTILRLQRDEFLPLRVIREELTRGAGDVPRAQGRRRRTLEQRPERELTLEELCAASGATPELVRELEEFQILTPAASGYRQEDAQVAAIAVRLARFGLGARHLRQLHSAIQRESGLLEQLLSPALRSPNQQRRSAGLDDLSELASACAELTEAILVRDLRAIGERPG